MILAIMSADLGPSSQPVTLRDVIDCEFFSPLHTATKTVVVCANNCQTLKCERHSGYLSP